MLAGSVILRRRPQHAHAHAEQEHANHQRGGFKAAMAVRMIFVSVSGAVVVGEQYDKSDTRSDSECGVGHQRL